MKKTINYSFKNETRTSEVEFKDLNGTYVVEVNGKKRSGKDFTCSAIAEKLRAKGLKVEIMSLAEPLKDIVAMSLNVSDEQLDTYKNDFEEVFVQGESITNFRSILQIFGTEAMKKYFGDTVWVDLLKRRISESKADYVLVPDFRFFSEQIDGAMTLKIWHDELESNNKDLHASETELDSFEFDYYIDNSAKDPDILDEAVNKFIDSLPY